jgi:hypothetical protein
VIVYCREHARLRHEHRHVLAIVEHAPITGKVRLRYRSPNWRGRHVRMTGDRYNQTFVLSEWTRPTVGAGGCECCGVRELSVVDLLSRFAEGRSKISR